MLRTIPIISKGERDQTKEKERTDFIDQYYKVPSHEHERDRRTGLLTENGKMQEIEQRFVREYMLNGLKIQSDSESCT